LAFRLSTPLTPGGGFTWNVAAVSNTSQSPFSSQTFILAGLAAPL
jgi:hypothetical protein